MLFSFSSHLKIIFALAIVFLLYYHAEKSRLQFSRYYNMLIICFKNIQLCNQNVIYLKKCYEEFAVDHIC